MQTFLPVEDFTLSAKFLDYKRLGKQRVEALQIHDSIAGTGSSGWKNHPAVVMWKQYPWWLLQYSIEMCLEWRRRGYKDSLLPKFISRIEDTPENPYPHWLGLKELHSSHRGNLIRKDPVYYRAHGWTDEPIMGYYWPVNKNEK